MYAALMSDDFTQCLVTNSRMAARAITRRYDRYLRGFGVTSTQLSLLAAIRDLGGRTVSDLAEFRGFDRTTLTRNLDRLEAMGLIESHAAERGNGRICTMTAKGQNMMQELLPAWRQAQAEMRTLLGGDDFDETLRVLKQLAHV